MEMQTWSEDIMVVELTREPWMGNELKTVIDVVNDQRDRDVVLDFMDVDIITSQSLGRLLRLRQLLIDCGRRLIFCNINAFTWGAFKITGLDGVFQVVDDKSAAAAEMGLEMNCTPEEAETTI